MRQPEKQKKFNELTDEDMTLLYSYMFQVDSDSPFVAASLYRLEHLYGLEAGELFKLYERLMASVTPIKGLHNK